MIPHAPNALALPLPADETRKGILRWLLAGTIVFLPIQIEATSSLRLAPSDLFLFITVVLGIGAWRGVRAAWSPWHFGIIGVFVLAIFLKSLTIGTVTQYDLLNKGSGIVLLFSFYACLTTLANTWTNLRWFLRAFAISVSLQNSVACAAFLWCKYTGSEDPVLYFLLSSSVDRLAGMLVDPNAYGGLLTIAYAVVLLDDDPKNPLLARWLRGLCLLSLTIGLLLTSSRSAWIGLAFITLFGAARNPRLLLVMLLMPVLGLLTLAYSLGDDGFETMLNISSRQSTIDERVEINRNALQMFFEHPVFGGGIGAFYEEHDIIVHNSAMWFLAEFGIVGFVIFVGFIGWFGVKALLTHRLADPRQRSLAASLFAAHLAMIGFSLGVEALYQRYWWLVMGMIGSAYALALREATSPAHADVVPENGVSLDLNEDDTMEPGLAGNS